MAAFTPAQAAARMRAALAFASTAAAGCKTNEDARRVALATTFLTVTLDADASNAETAGAVARALAADDVFVEKLRAQDAVFLPMGRA